ncbi:flagellar basal body P-ring protein FlgI [Allochromatium vinosum]|uniref:Flagellar P-ring protein n=1 Tax=Allochromatium vinosum (strain ATCC 17899 / DSM 180 / NBRC 103801 / NCIMB 10441 / D) TaxID=572477 RepID=D3RPN9_ALLVD|nr:flagellar basal body P-ring protein FlgI [Allochromatium vinosum]ADC61621.1 flagellar P-ring protein [Allochromatium vinosum DSM 180]
MNSLLTCTGLALVVAGSLLGTAVVLAGNEADVADLGRFGNWNAGGAERIKDLATIAGVRDNQLIGYGLVVGLDGTGDQTTQAPFSTQSLKNMLSQLGVTIPEGVNPQTKNMAAVMITADLPPFAKPGQRMDITVSSLGNAKSLRGGTLLMTPLKGADGQVYAIAQGNLTVGGFGAGGADGSRITVNVPSVGRVPNGATVEREVPTSFSQGDHLTLNLRRPDFTTAYRMVDVINSRFGDDVAQSIDGSSVQVRAPRDPNQRVAFVSMLENLTLEAAEPPARVVINARTGTIVMGAGVTVRPAAISHGNLTVTISENPAVSQPGALAGGQTAVVPQTDVAIEQDKNRMFLFEPGTALGDIVEAVNEVGAAPGDLVAILEALREAGALRAELVVI